MSDFFGKKNEQLGAVQANEPRSGRVDLPNISFAESSISSE